MKEAAAAAPASVSSSATADATADEGRRAASKGGSSSGGSGGGGGATWKEDEKSWTEYQGLTVVARMERVKAALQEGLARCEQAEQTEAAATAVEGVLSGTIAALASTLPPELRPSLPWSALANLINAGLGKVGWAFPEGNLQASSSAAAVPWSDCKAAMTEALRGLTHWLPDAALDHEATPTATAGQDERGRQQEPSEAEYRAMWPVVPGAPVLRVLDPSFPRRPYRARGDGQGQGAAPDSVHWGQRKLFMNELELLTLHAEAGDTVLYAGAAPGTHVAFLADRLFPEVTFVLVDPAPFRVRPSARIRLVQGLMTDELAREYSSSSSTEGEGEGKGGPKRVIFVSDIRRTHASEDLILEDMLDQQRWHDILRPKVSQW